MEQILLQNVLQYPRKPFFYCTPRPNKFLLQLTRDPRQFIRDLPHFTRDPRQSTRDPRQFTPDPRQLDSPLSLYSRLLVLNPQVKRRSVTGKDHSVAAVDGRHEGVSSHTRKCAIFVPVFQLEKSSVSAFRSSFKLSPGFHSFFIVYLRKLKSNSEEINVQPSPAFENSAQNPAALKPIKVYMTRKIFLACLKRFSV